MSKGEKLGEPWRSVHGAVWMIGLAILFWQGWFWPGILVLVGVSALLEAVMQVAIPGAAATGAPSLGRAPTSEPAVVAPPEADLHQRMDLLPATCPGCGAPVRAQNVHWTGPRSAECVYCGVQMSVRESRAAQVRRT